MVGTRKPLTPLTAATALLFTALPFTALYSHASAPMFTSATQQHSAQHPNGNNINLPATGNPATAYLFLQRGSNFRMGLLSNITTGVEVGAVDTFYQPLEDILDEIDDPNSKKTITELEAELKQYLELAGEHGQAKHSLAVTVPLFPLIFRLSNDRGFLTFNAVAGSLVSADIIDDDVKIDGSGNIETNTSTYIKSALATELSVGYSNLFYHNSYGRLDIGTRIGYQYYELSKQLNSLNPFLNDDDDFDFADNFDEQYNLSKSATGNFFVDVGAIWASSFYSLGVTGQNLNSPEFAYGNIGKNCAKLSGVLQENCYTAQSFRDEINLSEVYVADPQYNLDLSVYNFTKSIMATVSYDINAANDAVGDQNKNLIAGVTLFNPDNMFSSLSLSYKQNLVGSELSEVGIGLTFFGRVNLAVNSSFDTVTIDGTQAPRKISINLGISQRM